jgi:hypothetical protein
MLVRIYGSDRESEVRYSPAECIGSQSQRIIGKSDPGHISTSYVERKNWTARSMMRRHTRLSNGLSRKIENHAAAVAYTIFPIISLRFTALPRWRHGALVRR